MSKSCWENDHELYEDTFVSTWTDQTVIHCVTCKKLMIFYYHEDKMVWVEELPSGTPNNEVSKLLDFADLTVEPHISGGTEA